MLTNKKFIRLAALVMALLMTVAVFAGCSNKALQEQIDEANKLAEQAQQDAEEAAKKAEEQNKALQDLLDDLKNKLEEGFKENQEGLGDLEDKVEGYHPEGADPITKPDFEDVTTEVVKQEKLKAYTELTTDYTVDRADWYTAANYAKLVKIFEEAAYELYRATTIDGIDQIIAEASAAAAAVDSIVSDAAKVQALIDAFGDVETEIFTTNEDKVIAAREAFDKWVNDYAPRFFVKNGYTFQKDAKGNIITADKMVGDDEGEHPVSGKLVPIAKDIVDFARKNTNNLVYININDNTNSLLFAEKKIAALYAWALDAIKNEMAVELVVAKKAADMDAAKVIVEDLFKSVADDEITATAQKAQFDKYKEVLTQINRYGVNYDECKANADLIEAAYTQYRVFWNANGGDDTPIQGAPTEKLLTGTEFVKRYVQTLYDGQLREYQNTVNTYLSDYVVDFFMNNNGNGVALVDANSTLVKYLTYYANYALAYANDGSQVAVADEAKALTFVVSDSAITWGTGANDKIKADGVAIEHAFNVVAAKAYASIFDLVYSEDFKGNKSLDEAFVAIDQIVVKAIIEMTQVYYDKVIVPVITEQLTMADEALELAYMSDLGSTNYLDGKDEAFYANVTKLIADAKAAVKAVKVPTYEELNAIEDDENDIKNIEDQKLFEVKKDAKGAFDTVTVATGDNTALETILAAFEETMADAGDVLYNKVENIEDAIWFHELKVDFAESLYKIFGDGADWNTDGSAKDTAKLGLLGTDIAMTDDKGTTDTSDDVTYTFYTWAQYIMGGADKLTDKTIYGKINTQVTSTLNAIFAIEFMDYSTCEPKFAIEKYRAQNADNKDLFYAINGAISKDKPTNGKELFVIVDREVVAENAVINAFANGSNKAIKAFADLTRSTIKSSISGAIDLYKTNYSFGNLDPVGVYLEKDMNEFLAYLDTLTNMESVLNFTTATFNLANAKVAVDAVSKLAGAGYEVQNVTSGSNTVEQLAHIKSKLDVLVNFNAKLVATDAGLAAAVKKITGETSTEGAYYDTLAVAQLKAYLAMYDQAKVYGDLEDVRELSYYKDDAVHVTMPTILAKYVGTVKDGAFTTKPATGFEYDLGTARTELYLARLNEAYDRIIAKIEAVSLLTATGTQSLADAKAAIDGYVTGAEATVKYTSADDLSLVVAYARYYKVGEYNWSSYNKWMADND